MKIKNKVKLRLHNYPKCERIIRYLYTLICHRERLQKKMSCGENKTEKIIYLIRPNAEDGIQGLMSLFIQTMRKIDYAINRGYEPYVDFKNFKTQYYDGEHNVWEYYFTQPSNLTEENVYKCNNVILSGVSIFSSEDSTLYKASIFYDRNVCRRCHKLIFDNLSLSAEVMAQVDKEAENLEIGKCTGVYLRGTDYVKLKPTGEHVQPTIDMVIKKMREYANKYSDMNFFLVTEDEEIYKRISTEFTDKVRIVSFDSFISNYSGEKFLSQSNVLNQDKKTCGMDYLVKIILLAKCKNIITSITMGSIAAYALNGGTYQEEYVFDLGLYQ